MHASQLFWLPWKNRYSVSDTFERRLPTLKEGLSLANWLIQPGKYMSSIVLQGKITHSYFKNGWLALPRPAWDTKYAWTLLENCSSVYMKALHFIYFEEQPFTDWDKCRCILMGDLIKREKPYMIFQVRSFLYIVLLISLRLFLGFHR